MACGLRECDPCDMWQALEEARAAAEATLKAAIEAEKT